MNSLALDSSQEVLSLALSAGKDVFYTEIDAGQRHSELMMESIDLLFKNAEIRPEELNLVSCMKGPGSFTGLRIAYSTAKGLAMALKIPLVAIPTLDCLAHHLSFRTEIVIPAIDAKQGRFFAALFRGGKRLTDCMDASPEALVRELVKAGLSAGPAPDEKIILTGSGAALLHSRLPEELSNVILLDPQFRRGRARELLEIANNTIMKGETNDLDSGPVYIRKSDAELNRQK